MSVEHQRRVLAVLDEILELDVAEQASRLEVLCAGNSVLRAEVEALLEIEEPAPSTDRTRTQAGDGKLLEAPIFDIHSDPAIGREIGDYQLLELLGRGGMGTVYLAQRQSFEQRVAIKIIRRGLDLDPVLVQRFHNERQMLARLEHPGIARLLDGGTTGDDLPFVVMEFVEGEPIDSYCRRARLGIRERLELFGKVLDAVRYAHQNLIVHRDLKPSHILIDGDGQPKLLDFGIAKWLDESLAAYPLHTATGHAPMTPRYASPEQIRQKPISTASDIYVLGVLLYEILTGVDAYDSSEPSELPSQVCDEEPQRPSTAVRLRAEHLEKPEMERLRRRLAGDLDAIVLKAMRKDVADRYGSVDQLAADIERYLDGQPVEARRGSFTYRAGKLLQRHRLAFGVTALLIFTLGVAVSVSSYYFLQAQRNAERAGRIEAEKLLRSGLEVSPSARTMDFSVAGYDEEDPEDLVELSEIAHELGKEGRKAGDYELALEAMEISFRWAKKAYPPGHKEVEKSANNYAAVFNDLDRYEEAAALFQGQVQALEEAGRRGGDIFRMKSNWATALKNLGDLDRANELHQEILSDREELYISEYGPFDKDVATSLHNLAAVEYAAGRFRPALELATRALHGREWNFGSTDLRNSNTRNLLGSILIALDRPRGAAVTLGRTLEDREKSHGEFHQKVAETQRYLAEALWEREPRQAEDLLVKARETFRRSPGEWRLAEAESLLTWFGAKSGRLEDPEIAKASYETIARIRGEDSTPSRQALERWREVEAIWAGQP